MNLPTTSRTSSTAPVRRRRHRRTLFAAGLATLALVVLAATALLTQDPPATASTATLAGRPSTAVADTTAPAWYAVPGLDTAQRLTLFAAHLHNADTDTTTGPYTCRRLQQWNRYTADVHRTDTTYCRHDPDGSGLEFGRTLPDRHGLLPLPDGADRTQFASAPLYVQHYIPGEMPIDVAEPVPTDPAQLADTLLQHNPTILAAAGPGFLVNRVADLFTGQYLDRAHRAAALLVLAQTPGLTFTGQLSDLAGRRGMAFTLTVPDSTLTCIFNPTTGQLLAFTEVAPNNRKTKTVRPGLWKYDLLLDMRHAASTPDPSAPPGTLPSPTHTTTRFTATTSTAALDVLGSHRRPGGDRPVPEGGR